MVVTFLEGNEAILTHAPLLEQFAEHCGQFGAMHWLGYFLGGTGARWKRPCVVLFVRDAADTDRLKPTDLCGAALFFELSMLGISTGAFSTDDWEGLRTVVAKPALRSQLAALAAQALMQRGAHVVLTTYRCATLDETPAGPMLERPGVLWAEHERQIKKQQLQLGTTYCETLAKFGKQTRFNLRYYRKRLLAEMKCEFVEDAHSLVNEEDVVQMNATSLNPITEKECRRRYRATRDLNGGFLIALLGPQGQLLSILGGWRQGSTTIMHHQINAAGHEKRSLGTVMRAHFMESEVQRGTRTLIFYHGTNHTMSHAFEAETTRDFVVRRNSIRARLLHKFAGLLVSPHHYLKANHFGGSTSFFAAVFTSDHLEWHSVPLDLIGAI